mgnify:CR=1 FL=1|jgi:hypothetical protein|tara:strand:- start:823 stop:999 length:177 start_codon:yes stop_codon:yes gene_type:complete
MNGALTLRMADFAQKTRKIDHWLAKIKDSDKPINRIGRSIRNNPIDHTIQVREPDPSC